MRRMIFRLRSAFPIPEPLPRRALTVPSKNALPRQTRSSKIQRMNENKNTTSIPPGTRVLVTGATGFTGSVLTRKLAAAGLKVSAIARKTSRTEHLAGLDIRWHRGEVFDPQVVAEAASDADYIFHVAAAFREAKYADDYYRKVHVESTRLLAEAALKNPSFRRFVHISTMGVHGHIERPPADEESPFNPGDIYQVTKAEADRWLRDFGKANPLPFTIIRPAAIFGPGDKRLFKLFKMVTWPVFPILGSGKCLYHLIHVEDLTNIIICAATNPAALGEVFIAGNAEPIPLESMVRIIGSVLGKTPRIVRLPVGPFFFMADVCEAVCKPLKIEPPLYRRRVAFYTKDRAFNTAKLRRLLGYNYVFDNDSGLRNTAEWYLKNGWIHRTHEQTGPNQAVRS